MTPRIRPAAPADAAAIGRIHVETWRLTYAGLLSQRYLTDLDEQVLGERWRRRLGGGREESVIVAETDGHVAGFCVFRACSGPEDLVGFAGEIEMLYVTPARQRRQLGRRLFAGAADSLGSRRLYWLVVEVVEANHAARAFYRRVGLAPDGTRRIDHIDSEPVVVVRYAGPLNPLLDGGALARFLRPVGGSPR